MKEEIKSTFTKFKNFKGWIIRKVVKKNVYFLTNTSIERGYGHFNTIEECIEFVEQTNVLYKLNKKNVKNKNKIKEEFKKIRDQYKIYISEVLSSGYKDMQLENLVQECRNIEINVIEPIEGVLSYIEKNEKL